jgi:hypothetical protein
MSNRIFRNRFHVNMCCQLHARAMTSGELPANQIVQRTYGRPKYSTRYFNRELQYSTVQAGVLQRSQCTVVVPIPFGTRSTPHRSDTNTL